MKCQCDIFAHLIVPFKKMSRDLSKQATRDLIIKHTWIIKWSYWNFVKALRVDLDKIKYYWAFFFLISKHMPMDAKCTYLTKTPFVYRFWILNFNHYLITLQSLLSFFNHFPSIIICILNHYFISLYTYYIQIQNPKMNGV